MPEKFGVAYSRNITKDKIHGIGSWSDGELAWFIRTGVHPKTGRFIPPWMPKLPHMADEDLLSIISFLRSDDPLVEPSNVENRESHAGLLAKGLVFIGAFKPFDYPSQPIPRPEISNKVEYGRYLANRVFDCYSCHSADFSTVDFDDPTKTVDYYGGGNELTNYDMMITASQNITPDMETGIGKWSEQDFVKSMSTGFRPDGSVLKYPMMKLSHLSNEELSCIYQFLRTVPALHKANKAPAQYPISANTTTGEKLYISYGCIHCHSTTGLGYADLQIATKKYPEDERMIEFIKHPEHVYPGTTMPSWDGRIPDNDLKEIVKHVRTLGEKAKW
jgi:hypothetical protein